jgi:uracil-DNA glycosylase family 4
MGEEDVRQEYEKLVEEIRNCRKCPLYATRKNPVPGEGPLSARVMLVGEAPGRKEDEEGRPFVGMAGKLLTTILESKGIPRRSVYITNVVKCRPPGNRDPKPEEIKACLPFLIRQIRLIKPKVIVALGRISGKTLFETAGLRWRGISRERGVPRRARIAGVEVFLLATYHPAAAIYNPGLRPLLEEDIGRIPGLLEERGKGFRSLEDFF